LWLCWAWGLRPRDSSDVHRSINPWDEPPKHLCWLDPCRDRDKAGGVIRWCAWGDHRGTRGRCKEPYRNNNEGPPVKAQALYVTEKCACHAYRTLQPICCKGSAAQAPRSSPSPSTPLWLFCAERGHEKHRTHYFKPPARLQWIATVLVRLTQVELRATPARAARQSCIEALNHDCEVAMGEHMTARAPSSRELGPHVGPAGWSVGRTGAAWRGLGAAPHLARAVDAGTPWER
jgi:hypothetical protein